MANPIFAIGLFIQQLLWANNKEKSIETVQYRVCVIGMHLSPVGFHKKKWEGNTETVLWRRDIDMLYVHWVFSLMCMTTFILQLGTYKPWYGL